MTSLMLTRAYAVPPERIWHALTDPAALVVWFWPERFGTVAEIDLRPGGRYQIAAPAAEMAVSGEYVTVSAPEKLAFTWQWDGEDSSTLVTVTLTASGDGCLLELTHDRFPDGAARDQHAQGWSDCLDRLPAWLAAHRRSSQSQRE